MQTDPSSVLQADLTPNSLVTQARDLKPCICAKTNGLYEEKIKPTPILMSRDSKLECISNGFVR